MLRSSRLGDFICAMPALNLLRRRFPSAKILLLTIPSASWAMRAREGDASWLGLLKPGVVDHFLLFRLREMLSVRTWMKLRREITAFGPDISFIFPFVRESFMSRLKKIVFLRALGVRKNLYGWSKGQVFDETRASSERGHQIFGPLNALIEAGVSPDSPGDVTFDVAVGNDAARKVDALWREVFPPGVPVVTVFPGGTFVHKRWPVPNYVALCDLLLTKYPVRFAVVGGKGEEALGVQMMEAQPGRVHNWVGQTELLETAEVLRRSILFVGNDSGIAHLAGAVGTPAVTVFSAIERPGTWEPWKSRNLSVRVSVPCQYCRGFTECPTGTLACTREIPISRVMEMCDSVLSGQFENNQKRCLESR